jgi:hypothetical protein
MREGVPEAPVIEAAQAASGQLNNKGS